MIEIQVYDGDGISPEERITNECLALLAGRKEPRTLKMKWTVEAQEDFRMMHEDIESTLREDLKELKESMQIPKEMLPL